MAVAIDNTGKNAGATSVTSLTITSFAVGAGSNRLIVLGVSQYANTDQTPTAVFNTSETFSTLDTQTRAEAPGTRRVTFLYLKNPSNVTANIVVSWGGMVDEAVIGATSWTGVDQTTPLGTAVKNNGTGGTPSITVSSASGNATHDVLAADGGSTADSTGNQTERWDAIAASFTTEGAGQSAAGASSVTMSWTYPTAGVWCQVGADIKQVSAGISVGEMMAARQFGSIDPLRERLEMVDY